MTFTFLRLVFTLMSLGIIGFSQAQNSEYEFIKTDTSQTEYHFRFIIKNSNLNNIERISFYKSSSDTTILIKEIFVTKDGDYFFLADEYRIIGIQQFFYTELLFTKQEYSTITSLSYDLKKDDGTTESFQINKD